VARSLARKSPALFIVAAIVACTTNQVIVEHHSGGDGGTAADDGGTITLPDGAVVVVDSGGTQQGGGDPPFGASSGGSGGSAGVAGATMKTAASGITYRLIVPSSVAKPSPLLLVYSGTEGGATMTMNLQSLGPTTNTDGFIRAVLDGVTYNDNAQAGAEVLDEVRAKYDVDNDRTYLLGESAGTTAALKLGFHLRQSYFAAYWANDVVASDAPSQNAGALGFAPNGQAGPGGDVADATSIVMAMKDAGYIVPNPAPYSGAGSGTHGDPNQFIAAISFFPGKSRK
jgi:poly(3-hydroxybutyrate) depolymerase